MLLFIYLFFGKFYSPSLNQFKAGRVFRRHFEEISFFSCYFINFIKHKRSVRDHVLPVIKDY